MLKKTPLSERHVQLGARMVDFAGWWMPVQYSQLKEEHLCVREKVGLFDVSHMGEIRVLGPKALSTLQWLTTNDVSRLDAGQAQYNLLPNETGGLVDDIIVYCLEKNNDYLVCVNASNKDKDFAWMTQHNQGAELLDESESWGQIAIQGPSAMALAEKTLEIKGLASLPPFQIERGIFCHHEFILATTGYTGERGCEIFIKSAALVQLWDQLLTVGESYGVLPIGLGARDTLRTEAKFPLYGHEIDDATNPYAAGLGWVIKPTVKDFIGKSAILSEKESGLKKKLIGFKILDKGIPRQGYPLISFDNIEIGRVTSGTHSPSLDEPIGIGYVAIEHSDIGHEFWVDIRNRKARAVVCPTPFIAKPKGS